MTSPNNHSTSENPVGRFMVAVGAVIEHPPTGTILLVQRSSQLDWHPDEWEITYGRLDQFEDALTGLKREVREELGITDLEIGRVLSTWHIFRGEKSAHNELIGITFHCTSLTQEAHISDEHQRYAWVSPVEALKLITIEGIARDVSRFMDLKAEKSRKS
jgi:8-oxo-dGTP pyrophosphatase MutT (NUDIX family)